MKRLVLAAVALSMLAVPTVQAQAGPREPYGHSTQWKKHEPRLKMVRKHVHVDKHVVVRKGQPHWRQGQRYASWKRHHSVRDYYRYGLRRPAHGQEWIRVGNDYLLVGIATGLIISAIAAN